MITIQELHIIDGIPQLIFVRSNYTIEVAAAIHFLFKSSFSTIKSKKLIVVCAYAGDIPLDNSFLRQVSSLLRRLPAMESEKFQDDFLM
ncbi:hypothetical protein B296_00024092, partial [Ensete ventricosum]